MERMTHGRTPRGVRGLKSRRHLTVQLPRTSHPSRGAWIEIKILPLSPLKKVSHPSRGAWIEIDMGEDVDNCPTSRTPRGVRGLKLRPSNRCPGRSQSHPSRGAWIEITEKSPHIGTGTVAPLAGCVD